MAQESQEQQRLLHDKLKDQIAVSIKESLHKATTVLSSLHRVHSYLDILKSISLIHSDGGGGGGGEGIKSALDQVRAIRTDAAALLQTIYLTEIGLQSLQDVDKPASGTQSEVTIVPILGNSINNSSLPDNPVAINSNEGGHDVLKGTAVVEIAQQQAISEIILQQPTTDVDTDAPPAKKQNLGIVITKCTSCNRKFATDQQGGGGKCKLCRSTGTPNTLVPATSTKTLSALLGSSNTFPVLSSTPQHKSTPKPKLRKVSSIPMSCKVCGTSFVYRRCLFRHLRENHPGLDLGNIHAYIDSGKAGDEGPTDDTSLSADSASRNTSLNVTVGSEMPSHMDIDDSATTTEVGQQQSLSSLAQGGVVSDTTSAEGGEGIGSRNVNTPSAKQVYTCTICNKVFDRPYRLTRHLHIHDPNRPRVSCQICDRSFTRFDTLENHMKSMHSDERPYQCQYPSCPKSFATQTALTNHLKVHTNGKPYKCLECESSFSLLHEYKLHVRQAHADTENLRCSDCYRVFPDTESLETHRSVEHLLECEICGKSFARLAYLQLHVQVHSGASVYNCKVCSQGFDSENAYKQHMKTHPKSKKSFHCQLCDTSFEAPSNLIAHYRCKEHRDKATELGIGASTTILNTIEGDLSDMNALVDEVAMGTTPIAMSTDTMETKQIAMETNPVVLDMAEDDAAKMISAITESGTFET